jgi:hypothetical protein
MGVWKGRRQSRRSPVDGQRRSSSPP